MTELERQLLEELREAGKPVPLRRLLSGRYCDARFSAYERLKSRGLLELSWKYGGRTYIELKEA